MTGLLGLGCTALYVFLTPLVFEIAGGVARLNYVGDDVPKMAGKLMPGKSFLSVEAG